MRGYTLIEVVIALTIFAILGTLSIGLLSRTYDTKLRLSQQLEPLNELQLMILRMRQDISQIVARPIREIDMKKTASFVATTHRIELTRGGFIADEQSSNQCTLKRVSFSCDHHQLIRNTWLTLDGFDRHQPSQQIIMDHLTACDFSFISSQATWFNEWRGDEYVLPKGIQLHLNIENLGEVNLLFDVPGATNVY